MKLLLIGPYPPPHGGISIHVAEARKQLIEAGISCRVVNLDRHAPESAEYLRFRSNLGLLLLLLRHARSGWTIHLHTNGHNAKSWLLALSCGLAGFWAPACLLTVHSGMAPLYLNTGGSWRRLLGRLACLRYDRIIAVNIQIRDAIASLGVPADSLEQLPAYLAAASPGSVSSPLLESLRESRPLITTVLFYRPEYGFDLLAQAVDRLRCRYRNLRLLVMGSGEQQVEAERMIREKGLEGTVRLLGDLPHELCLAFIAASDLFVRATLEDGDSISVREALSLGIPTVVSDAGTRPPGALLFRTGKLDDLISQMQAALAMPRPSRNDVSLETAAYGVDRLLDIYQRVALPGIQL